MALEKFTEVMSAAAWTIGLESDQKMVAREEAAATQRARAVAREKVRRLAVHSRGVGNVEDPILQTSA